jgi:hypothetical protein
MKIVDIFAVIENSLLAVQFEGQDSDEFALLFNKWQDIEYLEQFFEDNISELQNFYGDITVEEAVFRTVDEASKMEAYIRSVAKSGRKNQYNTLQDLIFRPLTPIDYSIKHLKSKAYGGKSHSWLRLYAIRIGPNLYVVSGGAIKLTKTMNDRNHLILELDKLEAAKAYLKENLLFDEDDYEFLEISTHD